jgi:hypothetical protein
MPDKIITKNLLAAGLLQIILACCTVISDLPPDYTPGTLVIPDEEVTESLSLLYPAASDIVWDIEDDKYIASFTLPSGRAYAWFGYEGEWLLTSSEQPHEQLGGEITSAFGKSLYAEWEINRISLLERLCMGVLYVFGVSKDGRRVDVCYSGLGDFVKAVTPSDTLHTPVVIPTEIVQGIDSLFEEAEIIDIWKNAIGINVAILEKSSYRLTAFTEDYQWLCSINEISEDSIPNEVCAAFKASEYGNCRVDRTQMLQSADGTMYAFHFADINHRQRIMCIKPNGRLHYIISF